MVELGTARASSEQPTRETILETSCRIVSELLKTYGLEEDEDGAEKNYRIGVNRDDDACLALDIDAEETVRGVLIGRRGMNLLALERILLSSLHRRLGLGKNQRLGRRVFLSVNGYRPTMRRENGEDEQPAEKKVITIIVPQGVELRTLNPDGTAR